MNAYEVPIPKGAVINGQVIATSYFDAEGQLKYRVDTRGDMNLSQALGLLELCKISAYQSYMSNEPYDPDEIDDDEDEDEEEDDDE